MADTVNLPHTSDETWNALIARNLARFDEFEAPESDPAERDPEEADPGTGTRVRSILSKARGIVLVRVPSVFDGRPGYLVFWEDGTTTINDGDLIELDVCPIHGVGCAAWS